MSINTSKLQIYPLRGMDQRHFTPPNKALSIQDMTWTTNDSWAHGGGYAPMIPYRETDSGKIHAYRSVNEPITMHWFAQFNGAIQWIVYEDEDGALRYFNGSGSPISASTAIYDINANNLSSTNLRTMLNTPWSGTNYQTFGSRVYLVNGYDEPIVFDGRKASRAGFSGPAGEPLAELNYKAAKNKHHVAKNSPLGVGFAAEVTAGSVVTLPFAYRYKVSYVNERGQESPASERSPMVNDKNGEDTRSLVTLHLPIGPAGTVARRIYRTQDIYDSSGKIRDRVYGHEFFLLDEVQDNVTSIYVDTRQDIMLGVLHVEDNYGPFPSSVSRMACFKNTMFVNGERSGQVRFSYPRAPEVFPKLNILDVGDSDSGPIVAMYATKNALVVFKAQGIYLVKGDHINGFFSFTLTKDTGCIASKSIREIPGYGLAFMSRDGVYLLEGALENTGTITGVVRISQPIESDFLSVNLSAAENVRSVLNRRDKEFWLHVPTGGNTTPNMVFKYHWEIGEWSKSLDFHVNDVLCTNDHRNYVVLASSGSTDLPRDESQTNKGFFVYSRGYVTKGYETDVTPIYRTTNMAMQGIYSSFALKRIQLSSIGYGKNDLKVNIYSNRELTTVYSTALARDQRRALEDFSAPIYGTTKFDDGAIWYHHRPITVRYDVSTMTKGPVNELSFVFFPEKTRIEIMGYQMEAQVGTKRQVVNLTEVFGGTLTR